jgi:hypothetical protein
MVSPTKGPTRSAKVSPTKGPAHSAKVSPTKGPSCTMWEGISQSMSQSMMSFPTQLSKTRYL